MCRPSRTRALRAAAWSASVTWYDRGIVRDGMRYALRSLLKAREFTLVAVAIIAIAIGANTAVFSIVDAALLRPLPFKDSARLFILSRSNPKRAIADGPFSYPSFVELAARDRMLSGLAAIANESF